MTDTMVTKEEKYIVIPRKYLAILKPKARRSFEGILSCRRTKEEASEIMTDVICTTVQDTARVSADELDLALDSVIDGGA